VGVDALIMSGLISLSIRGHGITPIGVTSAMIQSPFGNVFIAPIVKDAMLRGLSPTFGLHPPQVAVAHAAPVLVGVEYKRVVAVGWLI
jgi:hypothetical protein